MNMERWRMCHQKKVTRPFKIPKHIRYSTHGIYYILKQGVNNRRVALTNLYERRIINIPNNFRLLGRISEFRILKFGI